MASPRWPSPGSDDRVRVAVRFGGRSADPSGEVRRLVESWIAEQARGGADSAQDLEQPPRVEMTGEGVDVVFEGRPENRRWNRWMTSFMRWVSTFSEEMRPVAIVDRTGGEVRPIYVAREGPVTRTAGPLKSGDWMPGVGSESVQMLYREMMNSIIAPFLRSDGFRRKGQQFDRTTNGYHEYFAFQKNRGNTNYEVSFTVNIGVYYPAADAEQHAAWTAANRRWGQDLSVVRDIHVVPIVGHLQDRLGHLLAEPVPWWVFRDRPEMEQAAGSVTAAIADVALPIMAAQTAKPLVSPSYRIEARTRAGPLRLNEATSRFSWEQEATEQLWPPSSAEGDDSLLATPPHTWSTEE